VPMIDMSAMILAAAGSAGLAVAMLAGLRGWSQWLELKRLEASRDTPTGAGGRSEIAELRRRVRKLEAIANGIDL
jgi:hypothetical protein